MNATHTYPDPVPPAPGSLPECGCEAPEWSNPANAMHGCVTCGRGIDPRLYCPGPPRSQHWPAWLAAREALEVELVAAQVEALEALLALRADQRRKDVGRRRSVERTIEKERETAKAEGRAPITRSVPGQHKRADRTRIVAAEARVQEIVGRVGVLVSECCMCALAWSQLVDVWRHHALRDPAIVAADNAADGTAATLDDMRKRGEPDDAVVRRALHNAEDASTQREIVRLRAVERVRLAIRHEVAGARVDP